MKPEAIRRRDLRRACIHESAHVVIATHYGFEAQAFVWPTGATDLMKHKAFLGRTWQVPPPSGELPARMIGLAGEVAEMFFEEPGIAAWEIQEVICENINAMSETDRDLIGMPPAAVPLEDIERCLELIRDRWDEIERRAADLAKMGRRLATDLAKIEAGEGEGAE